MATRLILLALGLMAGGCSTVLGGTRERVHFVSEPPGALVRLDTGATVRTPGTLTVEKMHHHQATVSLEGYRPAVVPLARKVRWYVMGNIFFLIVPGMLVDFIGGGAFSLPDEVRIRLTPLPGTAAPAGPEPRPPAPPGAMPEGGTP